MTNVHGHRPDRTANVDGVTLREDLVQITVLMGPPPAPRRVRSDRIASARDGHPDPGHDRTGLADGSGEGVGGRVGVAAGGGRSSGSTWPKGISKSVQPTWIVFGS